MRVLVIGGTGFIGSRLTAQLVREGHQVAVFHPGRTKLPEGVQEIVGDRRRMADHADALRACSPEVVVDVVPSSDGETKAKEHSCRL